MQLELFSDIELARCYMISAERIESETVRLGFIPCDVSLLDYSNQMRSYLMRTSPMKEPKLYKPRINRAFIGFIPYKVA